MNLKLLLQSAGSLLLQAGDWFLLQSTQSTAAPRIITLTAVDRGPLVLTATDRGPLALLAVDRGPITLTARGD